MKLSILLEKLFRLSKN